jgi:prenyltransferase beta subunit
MLFMLFAGAAAATPISEGVAWLEANQLSTGYWGDSGTEFRDAAVIVDVLHRLAADPDIVGDGLLAVTASPVGCTDDLARKIFTAARCGEANSVLVDSLAGMQNFDGGWGYRYGYGSNTLETALALQALAAAGYEDQDAVLAGLNFLAATQNANGSWGFVDGDDGLVYFTAEAVLALASWAGEFNVATQIQAGVTWLKTQQHVDDGFGSGASNPYETALAITAILKADQTTPILIDAINYLESTQAVNGSWGDDPYHTAMAVLGLSYLAADLSVYGTEIVPSDPTPVESDVINITAKIRNLGLTTATSVVVRFYDGDPELGGSQIGADQLIASIAKGAFVTAQVTWNTLELTGDHEIYVIADPTDVIAESEEINNQGVIDLHVYMPPDLVIEPGDLYTTPAEPEVGQSAVLSIIVTNNGEVTANGIPLQVYDGDPDVGGWPLLMSPWIIASLAPGGTFQLNLNMGTYFSMARDYEIHAWADVGDVIYEPDESNNRRLKVVPVGLATSAKAVVSGWTFLNWPLAPPEIPTAFETIPLIDNCTEVIGWDPDRQSWLSAVDIGSTIIGDDFSIPLRNGFLARATGAGLASFRGRAVTEHGGQFLKAGINLIGVPNTNTCYTGFELLDDIPGCTEAQALNAASQTWQIAQSGPSGTDFPVVSGAGYLVKVDEHTDWFTSTCDTLPPPILPDLLLTPTNIWFFTNPAPPGELWVGVNLYNAGPAIAPTPRVSYYNGDPSSGGEWLGDFGWPTIAPGDSSGWFGANLTFDTPGIFDIYIVADRFNEIEEMNEDNNQAYKTLTITTLSVSAEGMITITKPTGIVAADGNSGYATINPELIPAPPVYDPVKTEVVDESIPATLPKMLAASSSAEIFDINAGNLTSTSAVISWVTDIVIGGDVHYGISSVLEKSQAETGTYDDLHYVELTGLQPSTTYIYEVLSGGTVDNNGGAYYTFTTTPIGAGVPRVVHGRVLDEGAAPAGDIQVAATIGLAKSSPLIVLTDGNGRWVINLGNLKHPSTGAALPYSAGDSLVLHAQGGSRGTADKTVFLSGAEPQNAGDMTLTVCECGVPGDMNCDSYVQPIDVVYLINWIFRGRYDLCSRPRCPFDTGDLNCDGAYSPLDAVLLINYIYRSRNDLCDGCTF